VSLLGAVVTLLMLPETKVIICPMKKCFSTYRLLKAALILIAALAMAHASAKANTIYSLTLVPQAGSIGGTGLLTLSTPLLTTGSYSAREGGAVTSSTLDLVGLCFTMSDGDTFSLADESQKSTAQFFNGTLNSLSFNLNSPLPALEIGGLSYNFVTSYSIASNDGSIPFNSTPLSQTPEPTSLLLMVPMLVLFASWRKRNAPARG
jgi:hypothetical protein